MPEAPDLEIIKDFLNPRISGVSIDVARVLRPTVLRSLAGDFPEDLPGHHFIGVQRQGKRLLMELSDSRWLVIDPMLTGALQYCPSSLRVLKKTCLVLQLPDAMDLRYLDDRQMGKVYYLSEEQWDQIPQLEQHGPDVLAGVSLEEFQNRLKRFHGEIKGVLTRGAFVSGIGNAYSDEILFAARISPFRKSRSLTQLEIEELHEQCPTVVTDAMKVLRERMGEDIHVKIRDFLQVHNKGGGACPRCGGTISQLTANQRITSYCRKCQPGMLIKN